MVGDRAPSDHELDLALSPQQGAYFEAFGFLRLQGLFRDEIGEISAAFEDVFASDVEKEESVQRVHDHEPRLIVSNITDHHEVLARLPRILACM